MLESTAAVGRNRARAQRAADALAAGYFPLGEEPSHLDDMLDAVTDLVTDLLHFCDQRGLSGETALLRGLQHYDEERQEAGCVSS